MEAPSIFVTARIPIAIAILALILLAITSLVTRYFWRKHRSRRASLKAERALR